MSNKDILREICVRTAEKLRVLHLNTKKGSENKSNKESFLRFPFCQKDEARVSEQEARFLFYESMIEVRKERHRYIQCSIETPTKNRYSFSYKKDATTEEKKDHEYIKCCGEKNEGQSALTDLTLYFSDNPDSEEIGVEFKAHNPESTHISKDILKLLCEDSDGCYFHLLKNADSGTLPSVLKKILSLEKVDKTIDINSPEKTILFAIYVMEKDHLYIWSVDKKNLFENKEILNNLNGLKTSEEKKEYINKIFVKDDKTEDTELQVYKIIETTYDN